MSVMKVVPRLAAMVTRVLAAASLALLSTPLVTMPAGVAQSASQHAVVLMPGASTILGISVPAEAANALDRPFDDPIEVTFKAGAEPSPQKPQTCLALLAAQPYISGTKPTIDWDVLQQQIADCQALQFIAKAATPTKTAMPANLVDVRDAELWPASAWPAISKDEAQALEHPSLTLKSISGERFWKLDSTRKTDLPILLLESKDYLIRVQWLARGDFDGDGWNDWLLRWQAQVVGGSWRAARSLLLTRQKSTAPFTLVAPK